MSIRLRPEIMVMDQDGRMYDVGDLSIEQLIHWVHFHGQTMPLFYIRLVASLINRREALEEFIEARGGEKAIIERGSLS